MFLVSRRRHGGGFSRVAPLLARPQNLPLLVSYLPRFVFLGTLRAVSLSVTRKVAQLLTGARCS